MKIAKNFNLRMDREESWKWKMGNGITRTEITLRYLLPGEGVILNSLKENTFNNKLERELNQINGTLSQEFKVLLYPVSQKTDQYRRLILLRT